MTNETKPAEYVTTEGERWMKLALDYAHIPSSGQVVTYGELWDELTAQKANAKRLFDALERASHLLEMEATVGQDISDLLDELRPIYTGGA